MRLVLPPSYENSPHRAACTPLPVVADTHTRRIGHLSRSHSRTLHTVRLGIHERADGDSSHAAAYRPYLRCMSGALRHETRRTRRCHSCTVVGERHLLPHIRGYRPHLTVGVAWHSPFCVQRLLPVGQPEEVQGAVVRERRICAIEI